MFLVIYKLNAFVLLSNNEFKKKHSALKEGCLSPQARKGVKTENGQNQLMLKVV